MALRTVGVKLTAEISDYQRKMRQAGKEAKDFTGELDKAAKGGRLDAVADHAAIAGLGLAGAATMAVKFSMDFEKSMSAVSAATHASAKDMGQLREAAIAAGKDTQYSATEAADAITELSKAGVATSQILSGGLDGALDLAAAGQLDVAEAAETAASALTQFKLKGSDVPHVADLLAAGAGKAQGSVHDLGAALNQAGLIASQTGLSIEETTGGLAAFANAGLIGSDAGTSFKQMLLMLQAPSDKSKALMDDLGISLYDAQGQFIGLSKFAGQLRESFKTLTPEARSAAMAQIFGADATRAASIVYENGAQGIQDWINKVNDAGYASETAAKLTDNLAGDLERLKGSLETMAIEAGGGANSGLRVLAKSANALVDQVGSLPSALTGTMTVMAGLGGAALLLGAGWVKLRRSNAEMLEELRATGPGGERAARGLQTTTKWAGRAAAAFAVYEVASAAVSAAQDDLNPQIEALSQGLQTYGATGQLAGETSRLLGDDLGKLEGKFRFLADDGGRAATVRNLQGALEGLIPGLAGTDESLTRTKERVAALDGSLSQMVQGGNAAAAQASFDRLAKVLAVDGVSMDEFKKQFPQYAAALEVAGTATNKTAGSMEDMGTAAEQSAEKVGELNTELDKLVNAQLSADRAALKMSDGQASLTAELTKGARTLSLGTEEGRKNRAAVLDQIDSIEDLRKARVDEGMGLDVANGKYLKDIEGLKKTMRQAGFTKAEINGLVGAYEDLPSQVSTKVAATGTGPVQTLLDSLLIKQQALKKGISVSSAAAAFRKNAYHGGGWTGPGGKYDEAGTVHADEYVIRKESRQRIEARNPGLLDEMNATGQVRGYASGGRVVWPFPTTVAGTRIPSEAEAMSAVAGDFGNWPSSPSAQRGNSGVWRKIVAMINATGPLSGSFGNSYRPGDPKWHGSGRAVDWMGYNQDALATFLAAQHPLELIHRTRNRDYAYTRGRNKGSFNPALMEAHRNHIHIAMADGGVIREPVFGVGVSGNTYSLGENWQPERVTPMHQSAGGMAGVINLTVVNHGVIGSKMEAENFLAGAIDSLKQQGRLP